MTAVTPSRRTQPHRYRYAWMLFEDWCHGADLPALPAIPSTLAQFIAENPAATATQRARVSAINWHHDHAGYPAPGRANTIQDLLDTRRAARLQRAKQQIWQQIPHLPTDGWPQGLFGRRDAALLLLAAAGVPLQQLSRLRRDHIAVDGEALVVHSGRYRYRCEPHHDNLALTPAAVYRRWAQILTFTDSHPSTRTLAEHLRRGHLPDITDDHSSDGLVLTSIDRWGYLPLPPQPLTAGSIAAIVRQHLTGTAPTHTLPPRRPGLAPAATPPIFTPPDPPQLSTEYYDRGIAARQNALDALADVGDVLDDVEARADALLTQTLEIINQWATPTDN